MTRTTTAVALLAIAIAVPIQSAAAQNNTLGGALLGGTAGAMLGSQLEPRSGGYYWYDGRCWVRYGDGSYHRVPRRYCY